MQVSKSLNDFDTFTTSPVEPFQRNITSRKVFIGLPLIPAGPLGRRLRFAAELRRQFVVALALGPEDLASPLGGLGIAARFNRAALAACREGQLLEPLDDALDLRGGIGVRFRARLVEVAAPAKRGRIVDVA